MASRISSYLAAAKGGISTMKASPSLQAFAIWRARHGGWIPAFQDRYAGQDCILIANGPSLNKVAPSDLEGYHLIGMNKIHYFLERHPLKLAFHVSVNNLVIEQCWRDFQKLDCPSFLSHLAAIDQVPPGGNIHHLLTDQRVAPRFAYAAVEPLWEGYTVTYVALQLAYFMGFQRVFIIGMDHNFQAAGRPNEQRVLDGQDRNHFDPRYFAGQQWHLPDLEGSEMAYCMAKFAFERMGRAVVDATSGGHCRIFPKITTEDMLRECRKAVRT